MSTSTGQTIYLRPENVLEIAKNTLKATGWKCEWIVSSSNLQSRTACSIVLGSWNAYLKVNFIIFFVFCHHFFAPIPLLKEKLEKRKISS